jgi:hypothetical protein
MRITFLTILKAHRKALTRQEYKAIRKQYLSGDENGAIRMMDNIFRNKLREYVKRRSETK